MSRWVSLALVVFPLAGEDGTALIRQVVDQYRSATTLHFDCTTESELSSSDQRSWSRSRDILARQGPDRVRMETDGPSASYAVVSDGKSVWIASADTREFVRTAGPVPEVKGVGPVASAALDQFKRATSSIERIQENLRKAEIVGTETIDLGSRRVEATVVRADYDPPEGSVRIESWVRTYWIHRERRVILREESVSRGKLFPSRPFEDADSRHRKRCVVASVNEAVDEKLFAFQTPANYREMDKLERAFPRPAKQLIGTPAPELAMQTLTGESVKLSDYRGRLVLLDFWATWCEPCRTQLPALAKLYRTIKDQGVVLLGINDDERPETALRYLREQGYNWPNLHDGNGRNARSKYKVDAIPTLVLIDREGAIAAFEIGSGEATENAIRDALMKHGIRLP